MTGRAAAAPRQPWPRWAIWVPCLLALIFSGLLLIVDAIAQVMGSWDSAEPGLGWIKAAVAGHCALALASIVLLAAGATRPAWRRTAAICAWMVIPAGIGLLALAAHLS